MTLCFLQGKTSPVFNSLSVFKGYPMKFFKTFSLLAVSVALATPSVLRSAVRTVAQPSEQADSRQAVSALRQLFAAYAAGNQLQMAYLVEPEMIGYSRVFDAARQEAASHKQLRLTFSDTRTQVSGDTAFIHIRWEKRFIQFPAMVPVRQGGSASFSLRRTGSAWKLSAMSGDSPFSDQ